MKDQILVQIAETVSDANELQSSECGIELLAS